MALMQVVVRAQACGGKFLGMGVNETPAPTLRVMAGGVQVAQATFVTGNSGTVQTGPTNPPTYPIVVTEGKNASPIYVTGTYYVQAESNPALDSLATVMLELGQQPAQFTFEVTAYNSDTGTAEAITVTSHEASLSAGGDLNVVVPIDGLRITNIQATRSGITAGIAMMCGCKVTPLRWAPTPPPKPEPFWPEYEFEVTAQWQSGSGATMTCVAAGQFATQNVSLAPGKYTISIYAAQSGSANTNNVNKVQTTVIVS